LNQGLDAVTALRRRTHFGARTPLTAAALGCVASLVVGALIARQWRNDPNEPVFLYILPVVVAAIATGPIGGYAAAAAAAVLLAVWPPAGSGSSVLHLGAGAAALFLAAGLVGHFSSDVRRLAARREWLLERADAGVIELDAEGRITDANAPAGEQLGTGTATLLGRRIGDILPELPLQSGAADLVARRTDGKSLPVEATVSRTRRGATVALRDLTERRRVETALEQSRERARALLALNASEKRFRGAVDTMLDCFGIFTAVRGPGGKITDFSCTYLNHAGARTLGWPSDRIIGEQLSVIWPTTDPAVLQFFDAIVESGQPAQHELPQTDLATGETRILDVRAVRLDDGCAATWRDVTDRNRVQRELERSNGALEEFARVVSHDLTEPLWTISLYTQTLVTRAGSLDSADREVLTEMSHSLEWMQERVHDLLVHAKVRGEALELRPVDTEQVVHEAVSALTATVHDRAARIDIGQLPPVLADRVQIRQLFQNLLSNAVKYARPDTRPVVTITASVEGRDLRFEIADNGIGIPASDHERIFEVFQRAGGQDRPGTGIGLAVCRKIVELHGGKIWVESSEGAGSTFRFTLPSGPSAW
jgi:PAS domain S-box-containing protein